MPIQRALQNLSGTIERGFERRGDIALREAQMGLKRAGVERQIRQDKLMLPTRQMQVGKAQEYLREQERLKQPANIRDVNRIFGTERMSPLSSIHFSTNVLPAFSEASGWTTKEGGNLYRKDGSIITNKDLEENMPVMFGIYSTVTDPEKQLEDFTEHMRTNPQAPDVIEAMGNEGFQNALSAKLNPNLNQMPYHNWLAMQYENKINIGEQVAAALESRGGNASRINRRIAEYSGKLTQLSKVIKEQREASKEAAEKAKTESKDVLKYVDSNIKDWLKTDDGLAANPEQTEIKRNFFEERYKTKTDPNYKPPRDVIVKMEVLENGETIYYNWYDEPMVRQVEQPEQVETDEQIAPQPTEAGQRQALFRETGRAEDLYAPSRDPIRSIGEIARKGLGVVSQFGQGPVDPKDLPPFSQRIAERLR